ncbi:DUF6265 family protein [Mucilaginibacter sp. KACC 22063]|uniref:DUF6265 family protein n=1 Tax=Mucilaginibacter sp. KACC 22063 TaxID=3025666 RepID=UPI00236509AA|nr:DUF6265 family protein [Mucilaginibacter sp. KACC 22063]WDF54741.1 DUF6265 family protein [Mucilaginibacter sp. KACC 22063]
MKKPAIIILLLSITLCGYAQKKASINDLGFMSGTWTQKHEWGDMEEFWGPPMGNNMICSFRCVKDDKAIFYEFIVIEDTDGVPVMKLRHFKPGNIASEDKGSPLSFPLMSLDTNMAVFESPDHLTQLIYHRTGTRTMDALLKTKGKQGEWKTETFNYSLK